MDLKDIVKGSATLIGVKSGGVAVYRLCSESKKLYQLEIDITNKADVGADAVFLPKYNKALTLMRWIRRGIEKNTLIDLNNISQ